MSANTTISISKDLKNAAIQKARADSLPFSSVIKILLKDYTEGLISIGTRSSNLTANGLTPEQEEEILQAERDADQGINISGSFSTMKEIDEHLNSL